MIDYGMLSYAGFASLGAQKHYVNLDSKSEQEHS